MENMYKETKLKTAYLSISFIETVVNLEQMEKFCLKKILFVT